MRALVFALLAAGLVPAPVCASPRHAQASGQSVSRRPKAKPEKPFSYLSIDMGVRFRYPAEYTLVPSHPPQGLAEAAYHWVPAEAPHGPGAAIPSHEYHYSIQMVHSDFATAAFALGYSLRGGKWTHPEIVGGHFESVQSIRGNGWKGLIATFRGKLHSASGKDVGMAQGMTIVAGNDQGSSVILDFFPDRGIRDLRRAIFRSIRFRSPKNQIGTARKLFRSEKLGIEFKYPASYKLAAMKPFSPPGAASDSLPVAAVYELKPSVPPCCAGVGGYAFDYQYYIFVLKLDFLSAANGLGFIKSPKAGWTYKDVGELNRAKEVSGSGWKGLRMTYNFRLYRAPTAGNPNGGGYLGASEGEKTLVSDGGNRSVVLEFDPQQNDLRDVILRSLWFLKRGVVQAQPQAQPK